MHCGCLVGQKAAGLLWRRGISTPPDAGCLPAAAYPQVGHTDFVSALAFAPPGVLEGCPAGAVVSGSRDKSVMVWDLATAAPVQKLEGHEYQVGEGLPGGRGAGGCSRCRRRRCGSGECSCIECWRMTGHRRR